MAIDIDEVKIKISSAMKSNDRESLITLLAYIQDLYIDAVGISKSMIKTISEDMLLIEELSGGLAKYTIRKASGVHLAQEHKEWMLLATANLKHLQLVKLSDEIKLNEHTQVVKFLREAGQSLKRYLNKIEKIKADKQNIRQ